MGLRNGGPDRPERTRGGREMSGPGDWAASGVLKNTDASMFQLGCGRNPN